MSTHAGDAIKPVHGNGGDHVHRVQRHVAWTNGERTHPDRAGATCDIEYIVPSGRNSTAQGLGPKTTDGVGRVTWNWRISGTTGRGTGSVVVSCNGMTALAPITIG